MSRHLIYMAKYIPEVSRAFFASEDVHGSPKKIDREHTFTYGNADMSKGENDEHHH
jgi:hypothetical protein